MTQHIYHTVVKTTWQHRRQHDSTITGMTRHLHHTTAIKNELTLDCLHACMDSDREWWVFGGNFEFFFLVGFCLAGKHAMKMALKSIWNF
jgi:hypothetical protein